MLHAEYLVRGAVVVRVAREGAVGGGGGAVGNGGLACHAQFTEGDENSNLAETATVAPATLPYVLDCPSSMCVARDLPISCSPPPPHPWRSATLVSKYTTALMGPTMGKSQRAHTKAGKRRMHLHPVHATEGSCRAREISRSCHAASRQLTTSENAAIGEVTSAAAATVHGVNVGGGGVGGVAEGRVEGVDDVEAGACTSMRWWK